MEIRTILENSLKEKAKEKDEIKDIISDERTFNAFLDIAEEKSTEFIRTNLDIITELALPSLIDELENEEIDDEEDDDDSAILEEMAKLE